MAAAVDLLSSLKISGKLLASPSTRRAILPSIVARKFHIHIPTLRAASSTVPTLFRDKAFINGDWVNSKSKKTVDVINPANGKKIASVPDCDQSDAEFAVKSAKEAFKSWGFDVLAKDRAAILQKWGALMMERKEELGKLLTAEMGKPVTEAIGEITYAASFFEWFAQEARRINGEILPTNTVGRQLLHYKEPVGVAAMITPWNFPSAMITRKAGAALAAGCTCVVKPAEDTPLSALAIAVLGEQAGLPKGAFNVVTSSRENTADIGRYFCETDHVATISFTGSTAVGKILLKQSANKVKRVSLELGGNAPFIVFESADIDRAIQGAMASKFRASGQTCVCANRLFVQDTVFDQFVDKLKDTMKKQLVVGDGFENGVTQGPLINDRAVEKVEQLVEDARKKGANVVIGGKKSHLGDRFYEPTLLTNVTQDMHIANQEIFGPVAAIQRFKTEEDVITLANSTRVGLAGYFYSRDLAQIFRVARRLEVGMVGVNEGILSSCEAGFGGVKESGLGREGSHYGIDEYINVKYVCLGGL